MFYEKFNPEKMVLKEFEYWIIVLRPKQQTLGDAVIILKNEHAFIGDATSAEFEEFPKVVKWYEEKCKKLFNAEKFNYLAAMMKDNFVHFHAFPRYSETKTFANEEWKDVDWPRPITPAGVVPNDDAIIQLLKAFRD